MMSGVLPFRASNSRVSAVGVGVGVTDSPGVAVADGMGVGMAVGVGVGVGVLVGLGVGVGRPFVLILRKVILAVLPSFVAVTLIC